ncbi:MAG: hypothetical protein KDE48_20535 [Anaerolineales bacterium]|nr:hypothetical protein [Anaerolineales bacterium]
MPIETFAAFVVEQAVGIAVGVTAVVVAPRVVPVLVRARQSEQWSDTKVVANRLGGIVALPAGAVSRTVYHQVKDGWHWYGGQWKDLIVEVRDMQVARNGKPKSDPTTSNRVEQLQPNLMHKGNKGNKMKLCQFNFDLPIDPYLLMDMAKEAIVEHGGTVTGDLPEMMIAVPTPLGEFDGVCTLVAGFTIHVAVTRKPELVSCDLIRNKLVEYLTLGVKMHVQATKA